MAQGSWSTGTQVSSASLQAVSCASSAFCVAADALGNVFTYTSGTWSSGTQIDPPNGLDSVSCPSSSFCVAVDRSGNAYTYMAGSWSSPQPVTGAGGSLSSVSCPSSAFCIAGGSEARAGGTPSNGVAVAYTYSGGTWSTGKQLDASNGLASVSCSSSSFCAAVGATMSANSENSYGYTYTNGTWSTSKQFDTSGGAISVSCSSSSFCAAVGATLTPTAGGGTGNGYESTYRDGTWSSGEQVGTTNNLLAVSCPSSSYCAAVGSNVTATPANDSAYTYTYVAGSWSSGTLIDPLPASLISISCPSSFFCAAVGATGETSNPGYAFIYSGGS